MKVSDRLCALVHPLMAARVRHVYRKELRGWEKMHPESFGPVDPEVRKLHLQLWGRLVPRPCDDWLRLLTQLSGRQDYRFMPADVFYSVVERCLNDCNYAGSGIEDKNNLQFYVPGEFQPQTVLRYVRGVFFDGESRPLPQSMVDGLLRGYGDDVIGKQAEGSSGGVSVRCFRNAAGGRKQSGDVELTASWIASNYDTYIVQELVRQEPVIASFNPESVNTCRLVTFRRPWDGDVSIVAGMLRMGGGGGIVDNITSGGLCVGFDGHGRLTDTGVDGEFKRHRHHPLTGKILSNAVIPGFGEMRSLVCKIASKIPGFNLLGFDVVVREDGRPCILEVNATSIACIHVQMNQPFFERDTERVVDWCVVNRRFDAFKHFRTWY